MKYCWEYTDDYLEYRSSLGLDIRNPGYYIKDFSRYLKNTCPNEKAYPQWNNKQEIN